jgi:hypothetical protein
MGISRMPNRPRRPEHDGAFTYFAQTMRLLYDMVFVRCQASFVTNLAVSFQRSAIRFHNPIVIPAKAGIHYKLLDPVPLSSMGQDFNGMEIGDFVTNLYELRVMRSTGRDAYITALDTGFRRYGDWGILSPIWRSAFSGQRSIRS